MRNLCSVIMAISLSLLAFGPTAAFANSSNPKSPPFDSVSTGTHGGSNNTCTVGTDGCNTTTTTKSNPGGNNNTSTCTSPNKNVC
jgi:hypothetical protein